MAAVLEETFCPDACFRADYGILVEAHFVIGLLWKWSAACFNLAVPLPRALVGTRIDRASIEHIYIYIYIIEI